MQTRLPFTHLTVRRAAIAAVLTAAAAGCLSGTDITGTPSNPAGELYAASLGVNIAQMTKVSNDLYYLDEPVGTGQTLASGDSLHVSYAGYLVNGSKFDANAYTFTLGAREVIDGWELGLIGMKVGGKRKLVIGSNLGYGPNANGPIPPNSTLVFDVTLVSIP